MTDRSKNRRRPLTGAPSAEEPIPTAKWKRLELVRSGLVFLGRHFFLFAMGQALADLAGGGPDR
ncbi:MAG: hypothetical protein J0H61_10785, partial [Alphaproteobacteria bacterium]|nr:hypothetical protein [Alphaproteobacteria bacterium]